MTLSVLGARRFAWLGFIKMLAVVSTAFVLQGCLGYRPSTYADWDAKVRELCAKDGGVSVYERVKVAPSEYQRLGGVGGTLPVPLREYAKPNSPYVADIKQTVLHEANPGVIRLETAIVRLSDGTTLSRMVFTRELAKSLSVPMDVVTSEYG